MTMTGEVPVIRITPATARLLVTTDQIRPRRPVTDPPPLRLVAPPRATAPAEAWPAAFVDLYQDRYQPMVRYASLLVGSTERAEELTQEAFLLLRRNWDRAKHPKAYLRTTLTNLCRSHHRRHALEVRRRPPPPDHARLDADEMWDAIAVLPFRQRAVVVLRFYEDLPETEIAELLGCAKGTVASSLHRALARLRREMGE
jgi:RNA polymerase sigma-70 factor (sigma-E family)